MTATCPTCGGPRHPRLVIRQAVHVPPQRPPSPLRIAGMAIFMVALIAAILVTTGVLA